MQALLNVGELEAPLKYLIISNSFPEAASGRCEFRFSCFERSKCLNTTIECPVMC
jgi:hypothetical protein